MSHLLQRNKGSIAKHFANKTFQCHPAKILAGTIFDLMLFAIGHQILCFLKD